MLLIVQFAQPNVCPLAYLGNSLSQEQVQKFIFSVM